jgi:hypothetical protein
MLRLFDGGRGATFPVETAGDEAMRYGLVVGAALAVMAGSSAVAEVTRDQCLELLIAAENDAAALENFYNEMIARADRVSQMDSENPKEQAVFDATFAFGDFISAHTERYRTAVSDLCREKL